MKLFNFVQYYAAMQKFCACYLFWLCFILYIVLFCCWLFSIISCRIIYFYVVVYVFINHFVIISGLFCPLFCLKCVQLNTNILSDLTTHMSLSSFSIFSVPSKFVLISLQMCYILNFGRLFLIKL